METSSDIGRPSWSEDTDTSVPPAPPVVGPDGSTVDAAPRGHRRALVIGARTALLMILIAGVAVLAIGLVALFLVDEPELDGWLRYAFGTVFGYVALGMSAVLGVPSAIGVWAMAGAAEPKAVPALSSPVRRVVAGSAIVAVVGTAVVVLLGGRGATLLDLGLIALAALLSLGLAGAACLSPYRGRAVLSALAMASVLVGILWFVAHAQVTRSA